MVSLSHSRTSRFPESFLSDDVPELSWCGVLIDNPNYRGAGCWCGCLCWKSGRGVRNKTQKCSKDEAILQGEGLLPGCKNFEGNGGATNTTGSLSCGRTGAVMVL